MQTLFVISSLLVVLVSTTSPTKLTFPGINNSLYGKYLCRNKANGYRFIVPGSCSNYYECENGKSLLKTCARFYDSRSQSCVLFNTGCVQMYEIPDVDCTGPCCDIASGYDVDPHNPAVYYKCINSAVAAIEKCTNGLEYNLTEMRCDSPAPYYQNSEVATTSSTETATTTWEDIVTAESDNSDDHTEPIQNGEALESFVLNMMRNACRGKPNGFLMASLKYCNEFYFCHREVAMMVSCGKLYFNALNGICDLPENTHCRQA